MTKKFNAVRLNFSDPTIEVLPIGSQITQFYMHCGAPFVMVIESDRKETMRVEFDKAIDTLPYESDWNFGGVLIDNTKMYPMIWRVLEEKPATDVKPLVQGPKIN